MAAPTAACDQTGPFGNPAKYTGHTGYPAQHFDRILLVVMWSLAFLFVAVVALPVTAQTAPQSLTHGSHTFALPLGDAGADEGTWSMEVRARKSEDQIDVPAVVRFAPPADVGFVHATAFQIETVAGSRRDRNRWRIQLPRAVTLSVSRTFVSRQSFTMTLTPYTTVTSGRNASRGTSLSTWLGKGTHELSFTAGVAQDVERALSTTFYVNFGQALSGALRGVADVAYEGGTGDDWIAASEGMTYQLTPALEFALSSRQETSDAGVALSVNVEVNVRLGR